MEQIAVRRASQRENVSSHPSEITVGVDGVHPPFTSVHINQLYANQLTVSNSLSSVLRDNGPSLDVIERKLKIHLLSKQQTQFDAAVGFYDDYDAVHRCPPDLVTHYLLTYFLTHRNVT